MLPFMIFSGYTLYLQKSGAVDLVEIYNTSGKEMAIIEVFKTIPMSGVLLIAYTILIFVFLATTIDSTAYALSSQCCVKLRNDEPPARWQRLLWALILLVFALSLIFIGGLETVQIGSLVLGFPFIFLTVLMMVSVVKTFRPHSD